MERNLNQQQTGQRLQEIAQSLQHMDAQGSSMEVNADAKTIVL